MLSDYPVSAVSAGGIRRPGKIDLWFVGLDCPPVLLNMMAATLSRDEAERGDRFHFARDRDRFLASRGILRNVLSRYLQCSPREIRFAYQISGKPQIAYPASVTKDLRFNLSHSADAAVYAISCGRDVGVDIELICPDVPWAEVATTFFAPGEIAKLHGLSSHLRAAGFFNCWTRKEAYVKARGEGLLLPLDAFEVSLAPGEAPALLRARDPRELGRWSFFEISPGEDFAAALVVEGLPSRLRLFSYNWVEPYAPCNGEKRGSARAACPKAQAGPLLFSPGE
jgi:4'-phosphopantetheinyl transferase